MPPRPLASSHRPFLLLSTVGSKKEAKEIATRLMRGRFAACVNIVTNVDSIFRWRGKLDQARELLLVIKTEARHLKSVEGLIRKYHSYSVPELIGWPIAWGHKPYLRWLRDSV